MPVPQLPYKRPFFTITLNPHEIEEDLALIITNTKRAGRVPRRQTPPPERHNGSGVRGGEREMEGR